MFSQGKTIPMWRGHLALVLCRRQDAGWTQGGEGVPPSNRKQGQDGLSTHGLSTNNNRDEAATQ